MAARPNCTGLGCTFKLGRKSSFAFFAAAFTFPGVVDSLIQWFLQSSKIDFYRYDVLDDASTPAAFGGPALALPCAFAFALGIGGALV